MYYVKYYFFAIYENWYRNFTVNKQKVQRAQPYIKVWIIFAISNLHINFS